MAKIMIVDDSPADTHFMTESLKGTPHTVISTNNPLEVEHKVSSEKPDLMFLDVVMPERNGYEVLRGIKKLALNSTLKVVFVSSKGGETDVKWGLRQGAVDYLVKPYTQQQVLDLLARFL